MPPFAADIRHWPTPDAFLAYLRTLPRPAWCRGITNHNTYIPNAQQWAGLRSLRSIQQSYIAKGWSSGPHLFIAAESPVAADRGVWQLTPLTVPGTHAGPCNATRLGIEHVGDFDVSAPTPRQYDWLLMLNRGICQHWGFAPDAVGVHNECMPGRTCPGRYLTGAQIRADLARPPAPQWPKAYRARWPQVVYTARDLTAPKAAGPTNGATVVEAGQVLAIGDVTGGWAWIASGIGFVPLDVLEPSQ